MQQLDALLDDARAHARSNDLPVTAANPESEVERQLKQLREQQRELLADVDQLREQANDPFLATDVVAARLERIGFRGELEVGLQTEPLPPIDVSRRKARLAPPQLSLL